MAPDSMSKPELREQQLPVHGTALREGKTVYMPVPKLREVASIPALRRVHGRLR
ncbi:MAG: hypothetical protein HY726_13535 [Candidatus Rokubacteria bacterium]|nr:hypothetical protein [Candidatus Rokubacteria bacterium]